MPVVNEHPPGSFCWIELATVDQNAAKKFYPSLFGWSVRDHPMGPDETYTIFELEGRAAAAAYTMRPDERALGIPSHWMLYSRWLAPMMRLSALPNSAARCLRQHLTCTISAGWR